MASERSTDPAGKMAGGKMQPFLKVEMLDVWRAINEQGLKPAQFTKTPVLLTDNLVSEGTILTLPEPVAIKFEGYRCCNSA